MNFTNVANDAQVARTTVYEYFEILKDTLVLHELLAERDYGSGEPLAYWRSTSGFEVDFVIGDHTAIEVKAKENVSARDLKSLLAIGEERRFRSLICVSLEARPRKVGPVSILPWADFLRRLWDGRLRGGR